MSFSVTSAASVASAVAPDIFPVQPLCQFLFRGIPDSQDLAGEIECLARHWGVQVYLHGIIAYLQNDAWHYTSCLVYQRDAVSDDHQVFPEFPVHLESRLRQVYHPVRVNFPISLFRSKGEPEPVSRFQSLYVLLEFFKKGPRAVYIVERPFFRTSVHCLSVHFQLVCELYYLILSYFHDCLSFCQTCTDRLPVLSRSVWNRHPEKSTLPNASVGICQRVPSLASAPAAMTDFHSDTMSPVISISFTGAAIFPFLKKNPSTP